ncbi:hypothetical protein KAR91_04060 [Candidatus Pacearchaeota archaeon]|nr:hypothetical protein [Candidatus Pacearchaeota archaeon]
MITIDLFKIDYPRIKNISNSYAMHYFAGFSLCPILFLNEDKEKKEYFYDSFCLMVEQLFLSKGVRNDRSFINN